MDFLITIRVPYLSTSSKAIFIAVTSGQSYKGSTIKPRVVLTIRLPVLGMTPTEDCQSCDNLRAFIILAT